MRRRSSLPAAGFALLAALCAGYLAWSAVTCSEVVMPGTAKQAGLTPPAAGGAPSEGGNAGVREAGPVSMVSPGGGPAQTSRQIHLRVEDERGMPVANAAVTWSDERSVKRASDNPSGAPEAHHLSERLLQYGNLDFTNGAGVLVVHVSGRMLAVHASHADASGAMVFELGPDTAGELVVVVRKGDVLQVLLLDPMDRPIVGAPVSLYWPLEHSSDTKDSMQRSPLGKTGVDGRLLVPDWIAFTSDLGRKLPGAVGHLLVGAGYPGVSESQYSRAPIPADAELVLRQPRPTEVEVQVCAATGSHVPWTDVVLSVSAEDARWYRFAVHQGRARPLLVPDRSYRWRIGSMGRDFGAGETVFGSKGPSMLVCRDIVECSGKVHPGERSDGLRVQYVSFRRPSVDEALEVGADGSFAFFVGRDDCSGEFQFNRGKAALCIEPPPMREDRLDLGLLSFDANPLPQSGVLATLRLVDDDGLPIAGCVVVPICDERTRMATQLQEVVTGEFRIATPPNEERLKVQCSATGRADQMVEMTRGRNETVTLRKLGPRSIRVAIDRGIKPGDLWVRLRRRLDARTAVWHLMNAWAPAVAGGECLVATFSALPSGRYEVELLSLCPVSTLSVQEIDLGGDAPAIEARNLRQIEVSLETEPGGPSTCWIVSRADLNEDPTKGPLRLREVPIQGMRWTVRGDEESVVILGPGLVPVEVRVGDPTASARLSVGATGVLPSAAGRVRILRGMSREFAEERVVHRYSLRRMEVDREIDRIRDLPNSKGWLWPGDYEVSDERETFILSWRRGTWTRRE